MAIHDTPALTPARPAAGAPARTAAAVHRALPARHPAESEHLR